MSSKKNWPSMFKSKSCNNRHHEIDNPSYMHYSNCNIPSFFSSDCVPDPKPRWNPKPEQIRILESIFNSGIVNPPREEIQRIRIRLQQYGQIGDSNVYYWFQNQKSRAKNKLRVLHKNPKLSKKEKIISPSNDDADLCFGVVNQGIGLFPGQNNELLVTEPASFVFPVNNDPSTAQPDFGFGDFVLPVVTEEWMESSAVNNDVNESLNKIPANNFYSDDGNFCPPISVPVTLPLTINESQGIGLFPGQNNELLVTEPASIVFPVNNDPSTAQPDFGFGDFVLPVVTEERMDSSAVNNDVNESLNKIPAYNFYSDDGKFFPPISVPVTLPLTINESQVLSRSEDVRFCVTPNVRLNVFINDMPFEVVAGLFNVREAFGNDAVLINSFGEAILTDEFGVTFEPLQDGAVYYLI